MSPSKTSLLALCVASASFLAACGGSSSGSSSDSASSSGSGATTGIEVSGTATAPAGAVAMLEPHHWLIAARDLLISPAHAGIDGLTAVEGATVELIRVDNDGKQVGDVLATATTSISGDYTLTLPAGVNLAGNLVVRISGSGGSEMRAQVVQQDADINPISEYVLEKFVEKGTDLSTLETASVVKLSGKVKEFDLTASSNLSDTLAALETQTGPFVEDQIDTINSTAGDGSAVAGNYRAVELLFGLDDDDQKYGVGTYNLDGDFLEFAFADAGSGSLGLTVSGEDRHETNQNYFNNAYTLTYVTDVNNGGDTATATIDNAGVITIDSPFEEKIDGDNGWRFPPYVMRIQKALNDNVIFSTYNNSAVRYLTVDTNNDGVKDAVDPTAREGDEIFTNLFVAADKPTNMTAADLNGDYGRVFLESVLDSNGTYDIRVEHNIVGFDGAGTLSNGATDYLELTRSGGSVSYNTGTDAAATGLSYSVAADGSSLTVDGSAESGLFSASHNFLALHSVATVDDQNTTDNKINQLDVGTTFAVKLPTAQIDISGKTYRLFFMGVSLAGTDTELSTARFNSTLLVNNDGMSGTLTYAMAHLDKASPIAEVSTSEESDSSNTSISLAANGATTIVVTQSGASTTLNGYFSADGSLGVFQSQHAATGANPDQLGIVFLVEVSSAP